MRALILFALALAMLLSLAVPAGWAGAQPRVTRVAPPEGAVLDEPPEEIRICFSEPVRREEAADFRFAVETPEGRGVGFRTIFAPKGDCARIVLGRPTGSAVGTWRFSWEVASRDTGEAASGSITFTVTREPGPAQEPPPEEMPPAEGAPAEEAPAEEAPPAAPEGEEAPEAEAARAEGGGPDVLRMALITTASVLGAAAVGLALYWFRLRIGFWLHRPPPREGGPEAHH